MKHLNRDFFELLLVKLITTAVSVKVWFMVTVLWLSTDLLLGEYITGGDWVTVVVSFLCTSLISREAFKMQAINEKPKSENNKPVICEKCGNMCEDGSGCNNSNSDNNTPPYPFV